MTGVKDFGLMRWRRRAPESDHTERPKPTVVFHRVDAPEPSDAHRIDGFVPQSGLWSFPDPDVRSS